MKEFENLDVLEIQNLWKKQKIMMFCYTFFLLRFLVVYSEKALVLKKKPRTMVPVFLTIL